MRDPKITGILLDLIAMAFARWRWPLVVSSLLPQASTHLLPLLLFYSCQLPIHTSSSSPPSPLLGPSTHDSFLFFFALSAGGRAMPRF